MSNHRRSGISSNMLQLMNDDREIQRMKDWRESDGARMNPGLAVETDYNKQRAEWKVSTSTKLKQVGEILASRQQEDGDVSASDVSWSQVLNIMEEAEKSYTKKAENNRFRGWIREGEGIASTLERLTEIIPEQDGLSILRGGLAFIFQAWKLRIANVQAVLHEFHEVPGVLANLVEICDACHGSDNTLKTLVVAYYEAVVDELPDLVSILNRVRRSNKVTAVLKQFIHQLPPVEAARIDEVSKRLRATKQKVDDRIVHLDRNTWQTTKTAAVKTYTAVETSRKTLVDVKVDVAESRQENRNHYDKMSSQLTDLDKKGSLLVQGQEVALSEMRQQIQEGFRAMTAALPEAMQNAFYQFMADSISQQRLTSQQPVLATRSKQAIMESAIPSPFNNSFLPLMMMQQQQQEQIPTSSITLEDVITSLQVFDPTRDGVEILSKNGQLSDQAISYINMLGAKPHFRDWLASTSPCLLLVDGHSRDAGVGRTSPMSFFTASLAASLIRDRNGITVQFFCGRHTDPQSSISGPNGLLRSLISQMFLHPNSGISASGPWIDEQLADDVLRNDTDALCFLFETVFWQIHPRGVVHVLLDSVSDFESDLYGFWGKLDRIFIMFRSLIDTVRNGGGAANGPTLKVLATTPNRSHRLFRQVDRVSEHARLHAGDGDGGTRLRPENRIWSTGRDQSRGRSPNSFGSA